MTPKPTRPVALYAKAGAFLFGFVFLSAGLFAGYLFVLSDARTWLAARSYVPVPAQLIAVNLERHQDSKTTTYRVRAQYRYTFDGREYASQRVAISDSADNMGNYQSDLYARLSADAGGGTVTAWVDPTDPRRALLARDMRWGLFAFKSLFFLLFTSIGAGVVVFSLRIAALVAAPEPRAIPVQPSGRITSDLRKATWFWWGFAVIWNLVSAPGLFFLPGELAKGNWAALFLLVFTVAGVWLIYQAVHVSLQRHRFGVLTLTLSPYPGSIGATVNGTVDLPERFRGTEVFRATITCVRRRTTRSGNDTSTTDSALGQSETRATAEAIGRGTRLAFSFDVPPALPASQAPSNDYTLWTIHLDADIPGINLDCGFEIPMTPAAGATVTPPARVVATPMPEPAIPAGIVRIKHEGGATVFYYPPLRYPALSAGLLVFAVLSGGAVVFMLTQLRGGIADAVLWFMICVFGLMALAMFLLGLYTLGNSLRVEISDRGIASVRRVYGLRFARDARLAEIASIEKKIGSQSTGGGKIDVRYALVAVTRDRRTIAVGDDIPGPALADRLCRSIRDACGLRSEGMPAGDKPTAAVA